MSGAFDRALEAFVEGMGLATEADGLPRIAGRLVGLLLVAEEPLAFGELAERLQVSRGSVSVNTRTLEALGIVERVAKPGDRRVFYRVGEDPYGSLTERTLDRRRRYLRLAEAALDDLPSGRSAAHRGLERMVRFYRLSIRSTEKVLAAWREELGL